MKAFGCQKRAGVSHERLEGEGISSEGAKFRQRYAEIDLKVARADILRGERVFHDFVERVCTGYTTLLRAQVSSYRDRLNTVLGEAQVRGEYLGCFPVRAWEDGHSLHLGDEDRDKERVGRTSPREGDDPLDDGVVVHPSTGPS